MQLIGAKITVAGTADQSIELDLELPRGFVAKIKKVQVNWRNLFDVIVSTDQGQLSFALMNDPDDDDTTTLPPNNVEHDVIWAGAMQVFSLEAGPDAMWTNVNQEINFGQELDVIAARNLRFNIIVDSATVDGSLVSVLVWYTLEAIHDTQIMELLDIL